MTKKPTTNLLSILCLLLFSVTAVNAQDSHYSQFYASPLTLNPAMTGMMNYDWRVAVIHKNQNSLNYTSEDAAFKGAYQSQGMSFDMVFAKEQFKKDYFGAGILVNNESLFGLINGTGIYGSGSYNLFLDNENLISVGLQVGYMMKTIGAYNDQIFPNQVNEFGSAFDKNQPSGEFGANANFLDLNFGAAYLSRITKRISLINGIAFHHINRPVERFGAGQKYRLPMRTSIHSGAKFKILENFQLVPNAIFITQGASKELNLGTSFEVHIPENVSPTVVASLGSYYRMNASGGDAIIVVLGTSYQNINFGVSYDINMGKKLLNGNKGGLEFSLVYSGALFSSKKIRLLIDCPKW